MITNAVITGGSFTQIHSRHIKGGFELLQEAAAPGAFHNSGERFDPPKCHPNTRVAILKKLMDWILRQDRRTQNTFMLWLHGPAGAGKSAIAQTLAEMCYAEGRLLASFFFSRKDPHRGTLRALVATIAYQLCLNLPQQVYHRIVAVVERDPLIFSRSLEAQLTALIVEPLKDLVVTGFFDDINAPKLIIIDGLDECEPDAVQINILRAIFQLLRSKDIPLLFLIASRPWRYISSFFEFSSDTSMVARLELDNDYQTPGDIRDFLEMSFENIKRYHPHAKCIPMTWPESEVLDTLVAQSSGQFIYASTVVKFVNTPNRNPTDQLDIVLGITPSRESPFANIDSLYTQVLSRLDDPSKALQLIGFIILTPPPKFIFSKREPDDIERYLFLDRDVEFILGDLSSLIALRHGASVGPRMRHASFGDFLLDISRSKDLYLDIDLRHTEYALYGFRHIFSEQPSFFAKGDSVSERIFYHTVYALPTPEIQENVRKLTLDFLLDFWPRDTKRLADWIPHYLSFLENLSWDNDQSLYQAQLKSLDKFFLRHLESYFSVPFLFMTVIFYQDLDFMPDFYPAFPKACEHIDKCRIGLRTLSSFQYVSEAFQKLLVSLLEDPARSGKFFIDGEKCANAAIVALTYLSNHWAHPIPPMKSDLDRNIRRKKPRRWREKWGKHSTLPAALTRMKSGLPEQVYRNVVQARSDSRYSNSVQHKTYFNTSKYPYEKERHARRVFRFVLARLPYVLKRAGKSDRLLEMARQFEFGPRAKTSKKSARLGKKAIDELLSRFLEPTTYSMDVDD